MKCYLLDEDFETAQKNGISYMTAYNRFYRLGWTAEKTITKPVKKHKSFKEEVKKICPDYKERLKELNIDYATLYQRVARGTMTLEEALITKKLNPAEAGIRKRKETALVKEEQYQIAERNGINRATSKARVYCYGWSVERAITQKVDISKSKNKFKKK